MKTDLSIIIPVYNGGECIGECLKSIEFQQDAARHEIIVIDDGSTDNTGDIVCGHMRKFPNIRLIRQQNAGVSAARNNGIANSRGKYITFVDADDLVGLRATSVEKYFTANCVEFNPIGGMQISHTRLTDNKIYMSFEDKYFAKMLTAAARDKSDVVLGGKITLNLDSLYLKRHIYTSGATYDATPASKDTLLRQADIRENANFALYRREFLNRHGLRFISQMHLDEDMLFCMLAVLHADRASCVPDVAYLYNRHENSLSNIAGHQERAIKYTIAAIQRFSVLLQTMHDMPQYSVQYTYWLQYFANEGTKATIYNEHFPSTRCAICPEKNCNGCFIAESLPEKFANNIKIFLDGKSR